MKELIRDLRALAVIAGHPDARALNAAADALERAEALAEALKCVEWESANMDSTWFVALIRPDQMKALQAALTAYRSAR